MLTLFGKYCRKLRIDNGELLKDMADKFKVTSSYLSAVENGKRNIPEDWLEKLISHYHLNDSEVNELKNAIDQSQLVVKVDLTGYGHTEKQTIMAFAREFKDLDEDNKRKIKDILFIHKKGEQP